jgi:FkbH-like protein/FkbM family methyltransferase
MKQLGVRSRIQFAPYNQVFQQLLDTSSLSALNKDGINVVLVRLEDWMRSDRPTVTSLTPAEEKRLLSDPRCYRLPNNMLIVQQNEYETEYLYKEIFVDQHYLKHGITLRDADCVIDVGANIGLFTLFVQQVYPNTTVYAFEPVPAICDVLRKNAKIYGPGVKVYNCGLSDETKVSEFTYYPKASVFSGCYADPTTDGEALKSVISNQLERTAPDLSESGEYGGYVEELMEGRLDSEKFFCLLKTVSEIIADNDIERIDLLKIDAEKSELDILAGIKNEDWHKIKQIVMEIHDAQGAVSNRIISLLKEKGFNVVVDREGLLDSTGFFNIYATRHQSDARSSDVAPDSGASRRKTEDNMREFLLALRSAASRASATYFIGLCPPSDTAAADGEFVGFLRDMETTIASHAESLDRVNLIDMSGLAARYCIAKCNDPYTDRIGHIPYTQEYFTALGTEIARKAFILLSKPYKVIVLDCDQTLWKGVCAEDGPLGIEIEPEHHALQRFMVKQHEAGVLLCLCSKNNEDDVFDVFRHHPEMPLKPEHLVSWRINWEPKSDNLKALSDELGLSLDSFVCLDDNPLECAEISAHCPDVLALRIPPESSDIPAFLDHVWAFDHLKTTAEDQKRTDLYKQNRQREQLRKKSPTLENFLDGLDLEISIEPAEPHQLERVAQLTQRVNQFNATGVRYSVADIERLLAAGTGECLVISVTDRFGDYGLVGSVIFRVRDRALEVDCFLLSCRALGRNVEDTMLVALARAAKERDCAEIRFPYRRTNRNAPVLSFLNRIGPENDIGTEPNGSSLWVFGVDRVMAHPEMVKTSFGYRFGRASSSGSENTSIKTTPSIDPKSNSSGGSSLSPASSVPGSDEKIELLNKIANQFRTADSILKTIRSEKRSRPELPAPFLGPRTPVEETLAEAWADILRIEQVGIHDDFFELGGDSLLATQILSRLRRNLRIELPFRGFFETPTVEGLAESIELIRSREPGFEAVPLEPVSRDGEFPLSAAQERLWFIDQLEPGRSIYNVPVALNLTGRVSAAALEQSLNEIIRRHEVLRNAFSTVGGKPIQIIVPALTLSLQVVDIQKLAGDNQDTKIRQLITEETSAPISLTQGPLVRARLLRLSEERQIFVLTVHHIVCDGWSVNVLIRELTALYETFVSGSPSPYPELPIQYADFAVWQRQWLKSEFRNAQLAYWRRQLSGAPSLLEIPTDRPRPTVQTFRGATYSFAISATLTESLKDLSRREHVTLFMTLLAVFQAMLHNYTNSDDIVVGTEIANRRRRELENVIGFFVNTLVLRGNLSGNPTFREMLGRARTVCLAAYDYQDLPFNTLVEALKPKRDLSYTPLVQVMLLLQNAPVLPRSLPDLEVSSLLVDLKRSRFDLAMILTDTEEGLTATVEYCTDLFDVSTITRISERFRTILKQVVARPGVRLDALKETFVRTDKQLRMLKQKERKDANIERLRRIKRKSVDSSHGVDKADR